MNFTEHMKRIIQLAEQSLVHSQAEKFEPASECLINISINANEAIQQLDELSLMKYQGTDPDKRLEGEKNGA
ncbi:hypothetical protein ES703_72306 [subsurface metagenome]